MGLPAADIGPTAADMSPCQPMDEVCNGRDDDCDGRVDEALGGRPCETGLAGVCSAGQTACVEGERSCQALSAPGDEVCDALDNDCSGAVDDVPGVGEACRAGQGACVAEGALVCSDEGVVCDARPGEPRPEQCDAIDDDCDGEVDEGDVCAMPACDDDDALEDNDDAADASLVPLRRADGFFASYDVPRDLRLCGGDEDWLLVPSAQVEWAETYLFLHARHEDALRCLISCEDGVDPPQPLPARPENTLTIEVYHAATMERITAITSERGRINLADGDPRYADDIYIRVFAPPVADSGYRLEFNKRSGLFEDECEC